MSEQLNLAMIGPGVWGQALARHILQYNTCSLSMISRSANNNRHKQAQINYSNDINQCLNSDAIIISTPSTAVSSILTHILEHNYQKPILCASKGLANYQEQYYLFHEIPELLAKPNHISYLSGPTFAHELARDIFTSAVISGQHKEFWQKILQNNHLHINLVDDNTGVALCGLYKNIAAMLAGCCQPPQLGENTRAALLSKAVFALEHAIKACHGKTATAWSVAGMGDIILSGNSNASRNFQYGYNLAMQNQHPSITTESINNINKIAQYLQKHNYQCSLIKLANNVISTPSLAKQFIQAWLID